MCVIRVLYALLESLPQHQPLQLKSLDPLSRARLRKPVYNGTTFHHIQVYIIALGKPQSPKKGLVHMAIFRAETKHISRGKGHNVVAAAAYRAGEKLTDTNILNPDAVTHDYTKKQGILAKSIILPTELREKGFSIDRQTLWSGVEQHETTTRSVKGSRLKQKARLAREWLLSLPSELSDVENEELTAEFTQQLADDLGVIGDYCIHIPTANDIKPKIGGGSRFSDPEQGDERNIHAHIMFTTRKASMKADGSLSLGDKADSDRSEMWRKDNGMVNGGDYIKQVRELWADMVNKRLAQHQIPLISHKSYKDLGLDIIPQIKEGKNATVLARYGLETRIRKANDDIEERNRAVIKSTASSCIASIGTTTEKADSWIDRASAISYDSEQATKVFDEQSIVFNRIAERADKILARQSTALIKQAVQKYEDINSYEPTIQQSDWSAKVVGSEPKLNPEPNPILEFNQRQCDIINNMSDHLTGFSGRYLSNTQLRDSLADNENKRILILLTDPEREERLYKQDEMDCTEQAIISSPSLDITQQLQSGSGQEERKLTPHTPRHTYTPP